MKTVLLFAAPLLVVALLMAPLVPVYRGVTTGVKAKRSIICNLCAFFGLCLLMMILPIGGFVSAAAQKPLKRLSAWDRALAIWRLLW